jgi:hypothetical protein
VKKAEREHLNKVAELGCIVCYNNGHAGTPAEIHHINANGMGMRSDNYSVIPLCPYHHRNGGYGEAVHAGLVAFEKKYGTEAELLKQVRERVGK